MRGVGGRRGVMGSFFFYVRQRFWLYSHGVTFSFTRREKYSNDDAFTLTLRARNQPVGYDMMCCGTGVAAYVYTLCCVEVISHRSNFLCTKLSPSMILL